MTDATDPPDRISQDATEIKTAAADMIDADQKLRADEAQRTALLEERARLDAKLNSSSADVAADKERIAHDDDTIREKERDISAAIGGSATTPPSAGGGNCEPPSSSTEHPGGGLPPMPRPPRPRVG